MLPIKSSLAPEGDSIAFRFEGKRGLVWIGKTNIALKDRNEFNIDNSKTSLAKRLVLEILETKDVLSKEILNKLKLMGISARTANEVKSELGVTSYRKDGTWYWHLDNYNEVKDDNNVPK